MKLWLECYALCLYLDMLSEKRMIWNHKHSWRWKKHFNYVSMVVNFLHSMLTDHCLINTGRKQGVSRWINVRLKNLLGLCRLGPALSSNMPLCSWVEESKFVLENWKPKVCVYFPWLFALLELDWITKMQTTTYISQYECVYYLYLFSRSLFTFGYEWGPSPPALGSYPGHRGKSWSLGLDHGLCSSVSLSKSQRLLLSLGFPILQPRSIKHTHSSLFLIDNNSVQLFLELAMCILQFYVFQMFFINSIKKTP